MKPKIEQDKNGKWNVVIEAPTGRWSPLGMIWLETEAEAQRLAATLTQNAEASHLHSHLTP